MKAVILIVTIVFFSLAGKLSAQTTTVVQTSATTVLGIDLYNTHKYKDAILELNKSIKDDPKDGKAFYYRGMAKMHDGQKGFCKDLEESFTLGYSTSADIYYYGCDTHPRK